MRSPLIVSTRGARSFSIGALYGSTISNQRETSKQFHKFAGCLLHHLDLESSALVRGGRPVMIYSSVMLCVRSVECALWLERRKGRVA